METTTSAAPRPDSDTVAHLRRLTANTIRTLSMDAVQKANSGHPGMPMGMADVATVLWSRFLKFDPDAPEWINRDRFVLSAGHGSMLLYSLLHLAGFDMPMEQLKAFRQWESKTPGHPEHGQADGVETTTGPLGQGLANAIGMALAERHLAARFNRPGYPVFDHHTYVIASDGDLMEGVTNEASSIAGHLRLGRLIVLYDDNGITIDGQTDLSFSEDVVKRYEALGWQAFHVDGHDPDAVEEAIKKAKADPRPSLIACRTHIGFGSPNKQDTASSHGSPLGEEEIELTKKALGWELDPFEVPDEVYEFLSESAHRGTERRGQWDGMIAAWSEAYPELKSALDDALAGKPADGWESELSQAFEVGASVATRKASGKVLSVLKEAWPSLIGGSADLTPSNNTQVAEDEDVTADHYDGRYIRFGVREHAMGSMMNGITLHGGVQVYGGTFLIFSDYMRPAIRLAALMNTPTMFVFTHDGIGLGEDGPTHQPIEQLAALRAIPNLPVFRPADATETVVAWKLMAEQDGPSLIALTRQGLPVLPAAATAGAVHGGYVVKDHANPSVILIGTGSEVHIALAAADKLAQQGVGARVVSMMCWELFDAQSREYRHSVLPPSIKARVSIEAGSTLGWERYVGDAGSVIGLERFGASAPYKEIYSGLSLTSERVVEAALESVEKASES